MCINSLYRWYIRTEIFLLLLYAQYALMTNTVVDIVVFVNNIGCVIVIIYMVYSYVMKLLWDQLEN